jgi:excisionase family DNA binding protein
MGGNGRRQQRAPGTRRTGEAPSGRDSGFVALPEMLSVAQLAAFLRLDPRTLYRAIERDEVPGVTRIGRIIRIHRAAVLPWLSEV